MFNKKLNDAVEKARKNPTILVVIGIILFLISIRTCVAPKEVVNVAFNNEEPPKSMARQTAKLEREAQKMIEDNKSGIVTFEMHPPPQKTIAKTRKSSGREESIHSIAEAVSDIEDDLAAKNAVVNQISRFGSRLSAGELLTILNAAGITDQFYYFNVIKITAPYLKYPLTDEEIENILAPLTDTSYKIKTRTVLSREQMRSQ